MLVKNWMSHPPITIDLNQSLTECANLMKHHSIDTLPVMKKDRLVGIVTDSDVKKASASNATSLEIRELLYLLDKVKVKEFMTKEPISVPIDYTIEESAEIMLKNNISALPVIDHDNKLVGVVTKNDFFLSYVALTGIDKKGMLFAQEVEDRPGSIKEVTDLIRRHGGRLLSILSSYSGVQEGYRKVYIRAFHVDRGSIPQLKTEISKIVRLLYWVDHRDNLREIYETT